MIDAIFNGIDDALGTNAAVVAFTLIAFVPLAYRMPQGVLEWQNWLSQTCIQLIALAVIQRGGKTSERRISLMLKETHDTVMTEMTIIKNLASKE